MISHTKFEVSIFSSSKVIAKVKVVRTDVQTEVQTEVQKYRGTRQKQYAPHLSMRGHKNIPLQLLVSRESIVS